MKKILLFSFCLAVFGYGFRASAQQIDTAWTRSFGGSGPDAPAPFNSVGFFGGLRTKPAINKNNEIFIASHSESPRSGDVRINYGLDDILVLKLNQNGDTLWSRTIGGNSYDRAQGILALGDGGCIVVGRTSSTVINHQNGIFTSTSTDGNDDILTFRLSATGAVLWMQSSGSGGQDELNGIIRTHDKNIVVYGQWADEACALKLDTNTGAQILVQKLKISTTPRIDTLNNFTGAAQLRDSSIVFVGNVNTPNSSNADDMILCRMDKNLTIMAVYGVGTAFEDGAGGIVADPDSNFVYVAGRTAVSGSNLNFNIFVAKLNAITGARRWAGSYGGAASEGAYGIDIDAGRRLYAFGRFHNVGYGHPASGFGTSDFGLLQINPLTGDTLDSFRIGGNSGDECSGFALNATQTRGIMAGVTRSATGPLRIRKGGDSDIGVVALNIPAVSLLVDSTALLLAGAGGQNKSALKANAAWRASFTATWISVARMSGFGNDTLRVSAAANPGPQRSANVTLRSGFVSRIVTVTQRGVTSSRDAIAQGIYTYPNPSNNVINVVFDKTPAQAASYVFFDATGRRALKGELQSANQIDVSSLPVGIYKLQIKMAKGNFSQTICISR